MRFTSLFPVLSLLLLSTFTSAAEQPPNIVLLISDDDDYEHFGFMGDKIARTPTLDGLANAGSLFTVAHCPAPLCRSSLASLLSGKFPHQHGIYANYLERKGVGNDKIKLDPTDSLANRLKDAGYATYATAKYWEGDPRAMGFTHGTVNTTFKGFQQFVRHGQTELNQFIDQQGPRKPMFIWWAPLLPHKPHNPPAEYLNQFADVEIPVPPFFKGDREKYAGALRKFYAMGTWFDDGVAGLVEKLKAAGEYENTVFLFYVDNGYSFGIPAKNSPTEKGLRTPMFVSWPGKPGRVPSQRFDDPSRALDLHATAMDYAGIEPPSDIASRTLRPKIEGKQKAMKEAIFGAVYAHAPANYSGDPSIDRSAERDVYALYARTKRWKYVLYTQDLTDKNDRYIWMVHEMSDPFRRSAGTESLFDLDADPYEQNDLAALPDQKERVLELRSQALDWWHATGGKPLAVESKLAAATDVSLNETRKTWDTVPADQIARTDNLEADPTVASTKPSNVQASSATKDRPNIIVIMADDLGYADLGSYGCKDIPTPHIDRIAEQGARFTSGYATWQMCGPSRAGFLTGRYQSTFGYYKNQTTPLDPNQGLPKMDTIASLLQMQGYVTGGVGKWHMGTSNDQHPNSMGFDDWYGFLSGGLMYYPLDHPSYNGRFNPLRRPASWRDIHHTLPVIHNRTPVKWDEYLTHELTDAGIEFVEKNGETPFFLFMSYNAPHLDLEAPAETIAKFPAQSMTPIPGVRPQDRSVYGAMVYEMDQGVGQLLAKVDEMGLSDKTVVWFLSDHGGMRRTSDNRPLKGSKGNAYEGGLRVPLVVKWPGKIPEGIVLEDMVTTLDIGATAIAMAGGDPESSGLHGKDIRTYMTGQSTEAPNDVLYWHTGRGPGLTGVMREGDYKLKLSRGKVELVQPER